MKLRKCREHDFESGEKRPGSAEKDQEVTIFRSAEQDLKVHSNIQKCTKEFGSAEHDLEVQNKIQKCRARCRTRFRCAKRE